MNQCLMNFKAKIYLKHDSLMKTELRTGTGKRGKKSIIFSESSHTMYASFLRFISNLSTSNCIWHRLK